jgi:membrane-bound serine protease (ClpP class)
MTAKATNDAVAFIRSIAEQRGRNADWAADAVRHSVSITGSEALQKNVIDTIATSTTQLLEWLDGQTVKVANGTTTLRTKQADVEEVKMGFMQKLLDIISDPNVAYLLLMLGFYGILFRAIQPRCYSARHYWWHWPYTWLVCAEYIAGELCRPGPDPFRYCFVTS